MYSSVRLIFHISYIKPRTSGFLLSLFSLFLLSIEEESTRVPEWCKALLDPSSWIQTYSYNIQCAHEWSVIHLKYVLLVAECRGQLSRLILRDAICAWRGKERLEIVQAPSVYITDSSSIRSIDRNRRKLSLLSLSLFLFSPL